MDRRKFNKAAVGLFASLALPFKVVEGAAAPVVDAVGHCGITNLGMTTSFTLEQTFVLGQLELYDDVEEDPIVQLSLSFYLDKDRKVERTVYFEGTKKQWIELTDAQKAVATDNRVKSPSAELISDVNSPPNKGRIFYAATDIEVYEPGTKQRVPVNKITKDDHYDIHVFISEDTALKPTCQLLLSDYKTIDFYDWGIDEDHLQPKKH